MIERMPARVLRLAPATGAPPSVKYVNARVVTLTFGAERRTEFAAMFAAPVQSWLYSITTWFPVVASVCR